MAGFGGNRGGRGHRPAARALTALGYAIGYHPTSRKRFDSAEDAAFVHICALYAAIGCLLGVLVPRSPALGFIALGMGGLMRFRTDLGSPRQTGRLIVVALIGVAVGMGYPATAAIAAVILFALIQVADGKVVYTLSVRNVPDKRAADSIATYKQAIGAAGGELLSARRDSAKERFTFVFRMRAERAGELDAPEARIQERVPEPLRGETKWDAD